MIKDEASVILQTRINDWSNVVSRLDVNNAFGPKQQKQLIILLCEKVEELENAQRPNPKK